MAITTVYDVKTRYLLDDRASRGLLSVSSAAGKASRSTGLLSKHFGKIAALASGFLGLRMAKSVLIDFNSTMQQARIQLAGMIQLNMGGSWARNQAKANTLVADFQKVAERSVGTTEDFVKMAQLIVRPVTAAGLGMEELRDITAGATVAARAFGMSGEQAALDIEQALAGTLTSRDRFARGILEPMGYTAKEFKQLKPAQRAETLLRAFRSPAIAQMAKAQENSFAGVVSTFQDKLQIALAQVGLPLFQALTKEVQRWIKYLETHQTQLQEWGRQFGEFLLKAFGTVKSVISFVIKHRALLMSLVKAVLIFKVTRGISEAFLGPVANLSKLGRAAGDATRGLGGLINKLGGIGGVAPILGGVAVGAEALADFFDRAQEENQKQAARTATIRQKAAEMGGKLRSNQKELIEQGKTTLEIEKAKAAEGLLFAARTEGLLKKDAIPEREFVRAFGISEEAMTIKRRILEAVLWEEKLFAARKEAAAFFTTKVPFVAAIQRRIALAHFKLFGVSMAKALTKSFEAPVIGIGRMLGLVPDKKAKRPHVDVKIQKIEVRSDDPDRWVFGMVSALQDVAKSPVQGMGAFPPPAWRREG